MLQAEVGSAKLTPSHRFPAPGHLISDFTLPATGGGQVSPYDYRGRSALVIFFAGDANQSQTRELLSALTGHKAEIRDRDSEVLVILSYGPGQAEKIAGQIELSFPVLIDQAGEVHRSVGALSAEAAPGAALYVTDRFMEVYAAWRSGSGDNLPGISEVLSWLSYIDSLCPECTQVEWPSDE